MLLYVPVQIILLDQCQATHLVPAELRIVAQTLDVVRTYAQVRRRILARHPHLRDGLSLSYVQYRCKIWMNCNLKNYEINVSAQEGI